MSRKPVPTVPPIMNGLSASRVAMVEGTWTTVGQFLAARFPAVSDWPRRLQSGKVLDAQHQAVHTDSPCRPGASLWYWREPPTELRVPFELDVLYQDEYLVAVDKPHFLPVTPGGRYLEETVLVRLQRLLGLQSLAPIHRLDLETAGVVLFAVVPKVRGRYQSLFRDYLVEKTYEAIALWPANLSFPQLARCRIQERVGAQFMQMETVPGEPNAETLIEVIRGRAGCLSHFRLTPRNGRKHQLRVQLSGLGMPILGDRIYPDLMPPLGAAPDYSNPLQLLARGVSFIDPVSGQRRCFTSRRHLSGLSRLLPVNSE
jgi:tRNA pseudouridine32 synthase/23S rRNA pseudouridine746 synthase